MRKCKYDARRVCVPECDREICEFRGGENRFYRKGETPKMKKSKPKTKHYTEPKKIITL